MEFEFNISRIYRREFSNPADVETFINSVQVIEKRISSATLRLRLHQCSENPLVIFEIWEYPDEDTMEWVRQSLEGATSGAPTLAMASESYTAKVRSAMDLEE